MKIFLRVPLCWYGRQLYDICNDEVRGGWKWFGLRIDAGRIGGVLTLTFRARVYTVFPPLSLRT